MPSTINAVSKLTGLKIGGAPVASVSFTRSNDKTFNRGLIKKEVNKMRKIVKGKHPDKDIRYMISVYTPSGQWLSDKTFDNNEDPRIISNIELSSWGYKEWTNVSHFKLYMWKPTQVRNIYPPKKGGNDKYNNCLINCIYNSIGADNLPAGYRTAWKFKKNLGLSKNDMIHIDKISTIEDNIKVKINVIGDYEYTSKAKYLRSLTVVLRDGHYQMEKHKNHDLMNGVSYKQHQPIIFKYNENEDNYTAYDGTKEFKMTYKEKYDMYTDYKTSDYYLYRCGTNKTLIETYEELQHDRNKLYEESKHEIDLHKAQGSYKKCFFRMLTDDIKHIEPPEKISVYEEYWLIDATKSALVFGDPCEWTKCYVSDKNSAYPHAMLKMNFPTQHGTFQTITNDDISQYFKYGIYRCEIQKSNDKMIDRLFLFNSKNMYTHYDLEIAKLLNLKVDMICDEDPNFLCYTGKYKRGVDLFGKTIKRLYDMKKNNVHKAKNILSCGWGGICEKNRKKYATNGDDMPADAEIISFECFNDDNVKCHYAMPGKYFKHRLARMKPFILAYCRLQMVKDILPVNEFVIRCATDSIASTKPLKHLSYGHNIGQYKHEPIKEIKINNTFNDIEKR